MHTEWKVINQFIDVKQQIPLVKYEVVSENS